MVRLSSRGRQPTDGVRRGVVRRAPTALLLLSLAALVLGAGAATATADTGDTAPTAAQSNASVDRENVTEVYAGEQVSGVESVTDLVRTPDGGALALQYTGDPEQSTVLHVAGPDRVVESDPIPGTLQSITRVGDETYAAVGVRDGDALLAWIRDDGTVAWTETYGGEELDIATGVVSAPDGDAYVLASTESFGVDTSDLWVLRVDAEGEVVWDRRVEHEKWTAFPVGERLRDGSLIATIRTERSMDKSVDGDQNVSVARIAPNGTVLWRTLVVGAGDPVDKDEMTEVVPAHGDGVLITGLSNSGNERWHPDFWTVRLASDGERLWQRDYETPDRTYASATVRTRDGYLLAGFVQREGDPDAVSAGTLLAVDEDGEKRFTRTYDRAPGLTNRITGIDWATGGQLAVGGVTANRDQNRSQAWIADLTGAVAPAEPGPSVWETQHRASESTSDPPGESPGASPGDPVDDPSADDPPDDGSDPGPAPADTASAGDSSDALVLYATAAVSVVALFVPYGLRRFRRR